MISKRRNKFFIQRQAEAGEGAKKMLVKGLRVTFRLKHSRTLPVNHDKNRTYKTER